MARGLRGTRLAEKIAASPAWFGKTLFGITTWPKQEEIIAAPFKHRRTGVRGCVSSTKTFAAALCAWAWLLSHPRDGRVFHLAPSFRQVDTNMWGYLRKLDALATQNKTPLGAEVYKEPRIEFIDPKTRKPIPGWTYTGFSTDNPAGVHGIHGPNDLIILDDAHGIPKTITDELENMFSSGNTRLLMLFNPVVTSGETYDCAHAGKAAYHNIQVAYRHIAEARAAGHKVPGALEAATVEHWAKKFGKDSVFYRTKVDAEYPKEEKDQVVPLSWIEAACLRQVPEPRAGLVWHGQDVARFGSDESARCTIHDRQQLPIEAHTGERTTETAGRLIATIRQMGGYAAVDVIGVGGGVVDTCHEAGVAVAAVNVSERSEILDETGIKGNLKFANLRSEIWWAGRESLDPNNPESVALDPKDTDLHGQLSAVKWKYNGKGQIQVESKDDIIKRLGYSPDRADAYNMAAWLRGRRSSMIINLPPTVAERVSLLETESPNREMGALEGLSLG